MIHLGTVRPGRTIYIPFESFASATGAPITLTGLAVGDILVYKDGGTTQRASTSGFTLLDTDGIDFDGITGIHGFSIDLSDNTTAGFWAAGSRYFIVVSAVTVDSQTMSFLAAAFNIGYDNAILNTTIATLASQTSFTLTTGPAEDDALNGMEVVVHDVASAVQWTRAVVLDYTGSTKTVTLAAAGTFTIAASDNISILGPSPLMPTTSGNKLDVSAGGEAGVDWANVGSPTTTVGLSGTTVKTATDVETDTADIQTRIPAALGANGNIKADVRDYSGTAGTFAAGRPEVNTTHIAGSAVSTTTAQIGVNIVQISTDATAADNLEAEFDGTGYSTYMRRATAQTGTSSSITLDASASATTDLYKGTICAIVSGTGVGQARLVTAYNGTTKVASTAPNWDTTPDSTSVFTIWPNARVDVARWVGSAVNGLVSGRVDADMGAISTDSTAADNAESFFDGTGYAGTGNTIPTVTTVTGAVGSVTGAVGSVSAGGITAASFGAGAIDAAAIAADAIGSSELAASAVSEIWTTALTESYSADGAAPTPAQALFLILQALTEFAISGTTITIKKLDGSTSAATLTIDSATAPTSATRAT